MNPAAILDPRFRSLILHWLKVPPELHAPAGDPASLRIFRAGKHDLTWRDGQQYLTFADRHLTNQR